jgi:steroid 5-alpha reductase family enzyme
MAGVGLGVAALAMVVAALWSRVAGRVSVVDVVWGLGLVSIAVVAAATGDGTPWRRWLVAGLAALWGLRLAWHIQRRSRGHGEDPRYSALLAGGGFPVAVRKVYLVQGVAMWVVSWPVLAGAVTPVRWWPVVALGAATWLLGWLFEVVGDAQLAAYRADPDRPPVLQTGLWAWTRHPNYFGDAAVWWGLWLAAGLASGPLVGLLTLPGPLAMTWFLMVVSGARLLERTMMKRPGYPEYAARTPRFVPRPPRR